MNVPRKITIESVLNGFVCKVGCQTVVFTSVNDLVSELADYLRQPESVEAGYRAQAINRSLFDVPQPPHPADPCDCDKPNPVLRRPVNLPGQCQQEACSENPIR